MDDPDTLARMRDHQQRIIAILDRPVELIRGEPGVGRAALAAARWEMARRLREYELFKHRELFDPLIARGTTDQRARARQMKADCILLGEDFRAHVARWSGVDIADHWVDYHGAMEAITTRLRKQVTQDAAIFAGLLATIVPRPAEEARIRTTVRG